MAFNKSSTFQSSRNLSMMDIRHVQEDFNKSINEAMVKAHNMSPFSLSSFETSFSNFSTSTDRRRYPSFGEIKKLKESTEERTKPFSKSLTSKAKRNDTFKTTLCFEFKESGSCGYGDRCKYAHSISELKLPPQASPFFKTTLCRNFSVIGSCPNGARCRYIHRHQTPRPSSVSESSTSSSSSPPKEKEFTPWNSLSSRQVFQHLFPSDFLS